MRKTPFRLLLPFLPVFLLLPSYATGQSVTAKLEFQTDTMALGRQILLRMSIEHPEGIVVDFPRKPDEFIPFELIKAEAEPTRTVNGVSWDIVNYTLAAFELYPRQAVELSYTYMDGKDSVRKVISSDSVTLIERIPEVSENMRFKSSTGILEMEDPPNYMYLFGIILAVLAVLTALGILLRKPIRKFFKIRRMDQEWAGVKKHLGRLEKMQDPARVLEELNHLWKTYFDRKDQLALLAKTTTELRADISRMTFISIEQQKVLIQTAEAGDRVIYAGENISRHDTSRMIQEIKAVLGNVYKKRRRELQKR